MNKFFQSRTLRRASFSLASAGLFLVLSGCGMGNVATDNSNDIVPGGMSGIIHGGPSPIVGARVVIYATASTGYGATAIPLQEATQKGSSAHQDTDALGNFVFAGGYTCPAGAYVYIVAYGGNSGAGNNPNSILMTALGACSSLYASGTNGAYLGGNNIWINELTTAAAGYALSNFITITGNALAATGYTVGVSADSTNAAATGCVHNSYYGLTTCPTTATAGMAHAFANAAALVSTSTGQVNATTTTGAVVPAQLINTLGNILQACVNSVGGGTSSSTGLPSTTTTASGTSYDGTRCGAISAFTSYTLNGTNTGTLVAAGNTLGFIQNLAKHPTGSPSTFDTNCDSQTSGTPNTGSTTAAACIYAQSSATTFYNLAMTAAPPDWTLAIYYNKNAFANNLANAVVCTAATVPPTNGVLYPYTLATDINDNIDIVNGDASTVVCMNVISVAFDGTPIGATAFDNSGALLNWVSNDSFGHTIVPVHGTGGTASATNGIRVYATGTDTNITLLNTYESAATAAANLPYFTSVDGNDTIWIGAQNAANDLGYLALGSGNSHLTPAYTGGTSATALTGKFLMGTIDINNNYFSPTSSSSGGSRPYFVPATSPATLAATPFTVTVTEAPSTDEASSSSTSNFAVVTTDTTGNVWITDTSTSVSSAPFPDVTFNSAYTVTGGVATWTTAPSIYTGTVTTAYDTKITPGAIDGNNVTWWSDTNGSTAAGPPVTITTSQLHAFDTVNRVYLPMLNGCEFTTTASTLCGSQSTDATYPYSQPYAFYQVRGLAIDAAGDVWTANGTQGHITEVIGIAAPTWPMFIHNGTSNKP